MVSRNQLSKREPNIRVGHIVNEITPAGKETGIVKLLKHLNPQRFESYIFALTKKTVMTGIFHSNCINCSRDIKLTSFIHIPGEPWLKGFWGQN
jgi:hypothetical protein